MPARRLPRMRVSTFIAARIASKASKDNVDVSSPMKWILCTALAAGFVLGPVHDVAAQNDRYGIHTYYLDSYLAAKSRELGAGYVRIQIDWDSVQPDGPGD